MHLSVEQTADTSWPIAYVMIMSSWYFSVVAVTALISFHCSDTVTKCLVTVEKKARKEQPKTAVIMV